MNKILGIPPPKRVIVSLDQKTSRQELVRFQRKAAKTRTLCLKKIRTFSKEMNPQFIVKTLSKNRSISELTMNVYFSLADFHNTVHEAQIWKLITHLKHSLIKIRILRGADKKNTATILSRLKKCRRLQDLNITGPAMTIFPGSLRDVLNATSVMHDLRHLCLKVYRFQKKGMLYLDEINVRHQKLESFRFSLIDEPNSFDETVFDLEEYLQHCYALKDIKLKIGHYLNNSLNYSVTSEIIAKSVGMCIRNLAKVKESVTELLQPRLQTRTVYESLTKIAFTVLRNTRFLDHLPEALKEVPNLKVAHFMFYGYSDRLRKTLEVLSQNDFSLKELSFELDCNYLELSELQSDIFIQILKVIAAHPLLETLQFQIHGESYDKFSDYSSAEILKSLRNHTFLKKLRFPINHIRPNPLEPFIDMSSFNQLQEISMLVYPEKSKASFLSEEDIIKLQGLSRLLRQIPKLKSLEFGFKVKVNFEVLNIIQTLILESPKLTICKLSFGSVKDLTIDFLWQWLQPLSYLEFLSIETDIVAIKEKLETLLNSEDCKFGHLKIYPFEVDKSFKKATFEKMQRRSKYLL